MQASFWLLRPYNIVNKLCKKAFLQKVNPTDTIFSCYHILDQGRQQAVRYQGAQQFMKSLVCQALRNGFRKKRLREQDFLFRTVLKISQNQFTLFAHAFSSKFLLGALPKYYLLQPQVNFLYIILQRNKILVLFGWDFSVGN